MITKINLDKELIFQQQKKARDKELVTLRTELSQLIRDRKELKEKLLEISCRFEKVKFQISELKKFSTGKSINIDSEYFQKPNSLFE